MYLCLFAGGSPAVIAVWGGQTKSEASLGNFGLNAGRCFICIGLAAIAGTLFGAGGKLV